MSHRAQVAIAVASVAAPVVAIVFAAIVGAVMFPEPEGAL